MITCSRSIAFEGRRAARPCRRFAVACAVSVLVHVWSAQGINTGMRSKSGVVAPAPVITAGRAAPTVPTAPTWDASLAEPEGPTESTRLLPVEHARSPSPESVRTAKSEPDAGSDSSIASAHDSTYYTARELDVYPALTTPLDLRHLAVPAGVRLRALLAVRIDAHGVVEDVSVVEFEPGERFEVEVRRALFAVRFTPALKNGRTVKSRVLIRVDQGVAP